LRSAFLESVRLWPTTPAILRDSTVDTEWTGPGGTVTVPAGSAFLVYTPFLHRDDETVPMADRFDPDIWGNPEAGRGAEDWPIVPFSEGPGVCPGRNLVLLVASTFLAELVRGLDLTPQRPVLDPEALPATVSPYEVVLGAQAR
jgi:cytochrome P450